MNANELLFYLRGFAELVVSPSSEQWSALRNEILRAQPVVDWVIQVPMVDPIKGAPCSGCRGEST